MRSENYYIPLTLLSFFAVLYAVFRSVPLNVVSYGARVIWRLVFNCSNLWIFLQEQTYLTNLTKCNKLTWMAGNLVKNNRDFWKPDNSVDQSVLGKYVNSLVLKLKSNVRKIFTFKTLNIKGPKLRFLLSNLCQSWLNVFIIIYYFWCYKLFLNHNNCTTSTCLRAVNVGTNKTTWNMSHFPILLQILLPSIATAVCGSP
jgi:hypothetical protein